MDATDCCKLSKFLVVFWTMSLILWQTTNAQGTHASNNPSMPDSSYFFYQQSEYPRDCKEVFDRCSSSHSTGVYYIKPDGLSAPFEAYCDSTDGSAGWTVIHRREIGGTIDFLRDWSGYKNGFGFLSHEFWIGTERLTYLTNQNNYQLLIEFTLSSGSNARVSYNNFRVGDEFSGYKLFSVTQYSGNTDISWCPSNMVYGNCTCGQKLCGDPDTCLNTCTDGQPEGCICPDGFYVKMGACVPAPECGCYITEGRTIVSVFQRRIDGDVDFYLYWDDYKQGFGDVDDEHWLGNEQLYYLTNQRNYQLKIDLVNRHGAPYYAEFSSFRINNETDKYRLSSVSGYSGNAGGNGATLTYHQGYAFSTRDQDNDVHSYHCAQYHTGAWWYGNCANSNLNGDYVRSGRYSIYWYDLPGGYNSIKYTEMKIRPV